MNFEFLSPVQIVFGNGRINELGKIAKQYGKHPLIISGRSALKKTGTLDKILQNLKEEGVECKLFRGVSPEPKSNEINEAVDIARRNSCDLVIGLGGGSAIDVAKAVSVGVNYSSIEEIIGKTIEINPNSLPIITIPTTSGSGAEVTKGAIITDTTKKFKSGIRGVDLFPKLALVDPELTYSLPKRITIETGFDALTHAVETYISTKASPLTDLYAEEAMKLIREYLPKAISKNKEAREKMSLAALIGGINIANTGTCLVHRLQQAMGSIIEVSHGRGLAAIYPAWIKRVSVYRKEKFERISEIFGYQKKESYKPILGFMEKIGVGCNLGELNVKYPDINIFLEKISGDLKNDPIPEIDEKLIRGIYEESL